MLKRHSMLVWKLYINTALHVLVYSYAKAHHARLGAQMESSRDHAALASTLFFFTICGLLRWTFSYT